MEGWVGLGTTMVSKQSAQDRYVAEITVLLRPSRLIVKLETQQAMSVELTTSCAVSRDSNHYDTESPALVYYASLDYAYTPCPYKTCHFVFNSGFVKSEPIFELCSLLESAWNFQQNAYNIFHHTLSVCVLLHYFAKLDIQICCKSDRKKRTKFIDYTSIRFNASHIYLLVTRLLFF